MPKKSISSLELAALVNEMQFLVKGKIDQIYHQEKDQLLLQLHVPSKGKKLLKVIPGKFLSLTSAKETALKPSSFCMQLRKYLANAFIKNLYQKDSERIVIFELEKMEHYFLIIELFSKGNIVLTDKNYMIIAALENQEWKDRTVKPKEKYLFPPLEVNWKELSVKKLQSILKKSQKRNLATSLATEIGLGGLYAEELCKQSGVDLQQIPSDVPAKEAEKLISTLQNFLVAIATPKGYVYEEDITPFPLLDKKPLKETETYNEAIDSIKLSEKPSPYQTKIKTLQRTIAEQEEAMKSLKEKNIVATQKGELMYEKYTALQKLREIVEELKKSKNWNEIAKELKKEKKITKVNLEKKLVTIEL